mgnify:FL=1
MIKISILLLQVIFSINSFSQNSTTLDSTSILSYGDKLVVKLNIDTQSNTYLINDKLANTNLVVTPNNSLRFSLSLDYEFIGVSIGFSPKFLPGNDDDDVKGKSSFTDYGFRFFLGNWTQELIYSNIQGYYIENTQDFFPGWEENKDPYLQFPDLKAIQWGGSTSYILNERFSFRNIVYQTEWQRKSAGSFIPKLAYNFNRFSNKINDLKSIENAFDIKIAPSYYYTLVMHRNWFVSAFLSPAIGMRFSKSMEVKNGVTLEDKNQHFIKTLDCGLQLGFSSDKFIFGLNLNFDGNWYNEDKTTNIEDDKFYAKIYFGYRFDSPKVIRKLFNKE